MVFVLATVYVPVVRDVVRKSRLAYAPFHWAKYYVLPVFRPPLGVDGVGSGRPATEITLFHPAGLAYGPRGALFLSDRGDAKAGQGGFLWRIDRNGVATVVAGSGRWRPIHFRRAPLDTDLGSLNGVAVSDEGVVYVADSYHHVVWMWTPDGTITNLVGSGSSGFAGDGGVASEAQLSHPCDVAIGPDGQIYIADTRNQRIRVVGVDGRVRTFAGTGTAGYTGDGGPALAAQINTPFNIAIDREGRLLVSDSKNQVVRRVELDGTIHTIAGVGRPGRSGDGGPATAAHLHDPESLHATNDGRIYVGDEGNHSIRLIEPDGTITGIAGTGRAGFSPVGTAAGVASLDDPEAVTLAPDGTLLIADAGNHRCVRIEPYPHRGPIEAAVGRGRAP